MEGGGGGGGGVAPDDSNVKVYLKRTGRLPSPPSPDGSLLHPHHPSSKVAEPSQQAKT